eukprot:CAMPEP_0206384330 /NCGR_PEP_ID=MMETSP0294-20121207/14511_1 /ASSEMBLY_ACC=CAM_ASM_000327 /TAXON_ID=39354 /ORGANISM="Heterosigma akashiwo, Strain CCMP2393" /LENGTH=129 /DNA_ID=CAMNT_0053834621 /DNA_START=187 /DNA_END=576 /DNA_ORIENTATION=+
MIGEGLGSKGGGATLEKGAVEIRKKAAPVQKTSKKVAPPELDKEDEDCPMYRLILVADSEYEGEYVVGRLIQEVEDLNEDHAWDCYELCMEKGEAMLMLCPQEHAEHYQNRLQKSDPIIITDVVKDQQD